MHAVCNNTSKALLNLGESWQYKSVLVTIDYNSDSHYNIYEMTYAG